MSAHPLQHLYDRIPTIACKGHCGKPGLDTCCGPIACTSLEARLLDQYDGIRSPWRPAELGISKSNSEFLLCEIGSRPVGQHGDVVMDLHALIEKSASANCPHLAVNGRCTAYEVRPLICRLWGVVPKMRCPWGCKPERWLTDKEAGQLLDAAHKIANAKA